MLTKGERLHSRKGNQGILNSSGGPIQTQFHYLLCVSWALVFWACAALSRWCCRVSDRERIVHCRHTPAWESLSFLFLWLKHFLGRLLAAFLFFSPLLFFHICGFFRSRTSFFFNYRHHEGFVGGVGLGLDVSLLLLLRENILVRPRL